MIDIEKRLAMIQFDCDDVGTFIRDALRTIEPRPSNAMLRQLLSEAMVCVDRAIANSSLGNHLEPRPETNMMSK